MIASTVAKLLWISQWLPSIPSQPITIPLITPPRRPIRKEALHLIPALWLFSGGVAWLKHASSLAMRRLLNHQPRHDVHRGLLPSSWSRLCKRITYLLRPEHARTDRDFGNQPWRLIQFMGFTQHDDDADELLLICPIRDADACLSVIEVSLVVWYLYSSCSDVSQHKTLHGPLYRQAPCERPAASRHRPATSLGRDGLASHGLVSP
ncbi:hypothetical protein LY76DRAFT_275579 [Colletotrichum caudatum]|nr:hypothetical protein LY76DRAFT_275579 [Colletotrichum caudatum]